MGGIEAAGDSAACLSQMCPAAERWELQRCDSNCLPVRLEVPLSAAPWGGGSLQKDFGKHHPVGPPICTVQMDKLFS